MIVEIRSTGAQTVVGPSIHPDGERYEVLTGEPATVPAPMLAACVKALAEAVIRRRHGELPTAPPPTYLPPASNGNDANIEHRAIAYLKSMPPAISGQGGHSATYAAATALVHGFGLNAEMALRLLADHYN